MKQYEVFEIRLKGDAPKGSEAQVDVSATFACNGKTQQVKGFYDGAGNYVVRFLPEQCGKYTWQVSGALQESGVEWCDASPNRHGIVKAEGLHFKHADGTWFTPYGTTVYALIHQEESLIQTTMNTLRNAPFNKIRFCVFPKHYDFNHNEPKYYPFRKTNGVWDVHKPCYEYWHNLETRITQLDDMGIQGDLILFHPYDRWGFAEMGVENNLIYLDYLLRRLAAYPNLWWSMANEYDLFAGLTTEDWDVMTRFVAEQDPYGHLLSNHNCFPYWDFSQDWITHCCIQDTNVNEVPELQRKYGKPVVFDECRYEGNIVHSWGNLSAREMTHRFWTAMVYGGYCTHGETFYSEDEILWWAKGGVLKGKSPERIAFLRTIMDELPGPLEAVTEGVGALTVDMIEEMKVKGVPEQWKDDFFARNLIHLPTERILPFLLRHRPCLGHCGKDAYIRYFEKECTSVGILDLPEDGVYRVDIIDTWEMTRKTVCSDASGQIRVDLPGKEGMALLALKTAEKASV